jgi:2-polyprenyl-6-methoxyphenol hydroxylase-like FAD-dependent oxidoreductase
MRTLVAGGGIAGLSAAIAMRRAGHEALVTEKASELQEIGAALSLWPNALAALDYLGLGERVRACSVESPTASIRSSSGHTLVHFDTDAMRQALGGLPLVVLRADLQTVLLETCRELGVEVRLSAALRDLRVDETSVTAVTDIGDDHVDSVVGADGINSCARKWVAGPDGLRDCNRTAWRAVITNQEGLISETWLTVGTGLQLIASQATNGSAYWAADTPKYLPDNHPGTEPKRELYRLFGGWHAPIPAIIEATPAESLVISDIFDRKPPNRLSRDRIVLVGDAAHAMTPDLGQGACQGLEDAAILLACGKDQLDARDIFAIFERRRLRRVSTIVRDSYAAGRLATTARPFAALLRDSIISLMPEALNNRRLANYASVKAFAAQASS